MHLPGNAVEEHFDVPLGEHDNRRTVEESEEAGHIKAKRMIKRSDREKHWNSLRGGPHWRLAKASGKRRK